MKFSIVLKVVFKYQGQNDFDTGAICQDILSSRGPDIQKRLDEAKVMKQISAKLDTLYRMKFLSRKRVKRKVVTKAGVICYRGYKYRYRITPQGLSYLQYLRNPGPSIKRRQQLRHADLSTMAAIERMAKRLPVRVRPFAYSIYRATEKIDHTESIDERFPIPHDPYLVSKLLRAYEEIEIWKKVIRELLAYIKEKQMRDDPGSY